ncbi:hypothetical protein [Pseudomonas sp. GV071]|uniref:hypothetical protein n=1 Tax=Pseudomonas sp. GV071 TaxID=2135754 RepID=UPI000D42AB2A|nr:hypothetical protein [Pseudomonas sp. GV071]PTQ67907.1 hypothetical protein C8K61_11380 [Pseudomonas sp. GV071]
MAWFHFCTANHNKVGRSTLSDMAAWFEAGLLELGHKVTFSETSVERSAINLFWEYFEPGMREELLGAGVDFGLIATELPDGQGFNWRSDPTWTTRFNCFVEIAPHAKFIWTMIESSVQFYAQFCPTTFIELGFSERLIPGGLNKAPHIDFCFFGLRTPYRETVVSQLEKHAKVVWPRGLLSPTAIAELISNSRVGLNFKQSDQWPIPSPTRLGRLMMAKRAVAAEYVPVPTRQGDIAGICPQTVPFHEHALHILDTDWREKAERVFQRYQAEMPMALILEQVLDKTLNYRTGSSEAKTIPIKVAPPVMVGEDSTWNFFRWKDEYYSLRKTLGPVEVRLGGQALQHIHGMENILCANSLSELYEMAEKELSRSLDVQQQ